MPVPDYTSLDTARTRALERSGSTDAILCDELLEITSGTTPAGITVYRPYYVAARLLRQRRQNLRAGDGAEFRRMTAEASDLENLQRQVDETQETTVPSAFALVGFGVQWGPA